MLRTLAVSLRREGKVSEAEDIESILKAPLAGSGGSGAPPRRGRGALDSILDSAAEPWTASAAAAVGAHSSATASRASAAKEPWTASALSQFADASGHRADSLRGLPSPSPILWCAECVSDP